MGEEVLKEEHTIWLFCVKQSVLKTYTNDIIWTQKAVLGIYMSTKYIYAYKKLMIKESMYSKKSRKGYVRRS